MHKRGGNYEGGGKLASSVSTGITYIDEFASQAESYINAYTRVNWSDIYSSLNVDVKKLLSQISSDLIAMYIIQYDMSGYTTRSEAIAMLNLLNDRATKGLNILSEMANRDFVTGA